MRLYIIWFWSDKPQDSCYSVILSAAAATTLPLPLLFILPPLLLSPCLPASLFLLILLVAYILHLIGEQACKEQSTRALFNALTGDMLRVGKTMEEPPPILHMPLLYRSPDVLVHQKHGNFEEETNYSDDKDSGWMEHPVTGRRVTMGPQTHEASARCCVAGGLRSSPTSSFSMRSLS